MVNAARDMVEGLTPIRGRMESRSLLIGNSQAGGFFRLRRRPFFGGKFERFRHFLGTLHVEHWGYF